MVRWKPREARGEEEPQKSRDSPNFRDVEKGTLCTRTDAENHCELGMVDEPPRLEERAMAAEESNSRDAAKPVGLK
jgi:hypothetical protein